ncbi:MAG TPA: glycosyl transferase family 2, partial [Neisseria sp.]|nr:glycosyl transferase family 2 [Neisseria sp.]
AFGRAVCDRFAVWQRKIRYENLVLHDPDNVYADMDSPDGRGQIFVCSHVGNVEICRALVSHHQGFKLNVLVHSRHAQAFNEALIKAGADRIQLIQVSDLDAALMMELNARIEAGEWLAIAADRVPVRGEKTVEVDFLGAKAQLPQGAWLLAGLLKTQVHTLFCIQHQGRYHLKLRRFLNSTDWKRGERQAAVAAAAQAYADRLAEECAAAPLQWFNFYDFWNDYG